MQRSGGGPVAAAGEVGVLGHGYGRRRDGSVRPKERLATWSVRDEQHPGLQVSPDGLRGVALHSPLSAGLQDRIGLLGVQGDHPE